MTNKPHPNYPSPLLAILLIVTGVGALLALLCRIFYYFVQGLMVLTLLAIVASAQEMPHVWGWSNNLAGKPFIVYNVRTIGTNLPREFYTAHFEYVEPLNATNKQIRLAADRVLTRADLGDASKWPITMVTTNLRGYSSRSWPDGFATVSTSNTLSGAEWFAGEIKPRLRR